MMVLPSKIIGTLADIKKQNAFGWGIDPNLRKLQGKTMLFVPLLAITMVTAIVGFLVHLGHVDAIAESLLLYIPAIVGLVWGMRQLYMVRISLAEQTVTVTGTCADLVIEQRGIFAKIDSDNGSGWYVLGLQYQDEVTRGKSYILTISPSTGWVRTLVSL